ncbi:MAG: CHAT domain-containing tetratricopeptide repeat protein [Cyanobacteria bacterium P01_C01_bin.118]
MLRSQRAIFQFLIAFVLTVIISGFSPVLAAGSVSVPPATPQQVEQLFQQGMQQYQSNQLEEAIATWQQAITYYQQSGNQSRELAIYIRISAAYLRLGRPQQAKEQSQLALSLARQLENVRAEIAALGNLAIAHRNLGSYPQAIETYEQALTLVESLSESEPQLLRLWLNLGNVYESLGEYTSAIEAYQKSLAIAQSTDSQINKATILNNLGAVYAQLGSPDDAIDYYGQSLSLTQQLGDAVGVGYILNNLGNIYHQQDLAKATDYYEQSLAIAQDVANPALEAISLGSLGMAREDQGDYGSAMDLHQQALALVNTLDNPVMRARTLNNLGHTLLKAGQLQAAETQLREALDELESLRPGLNDQSNVSLFDTQILTYNLLQQILVARGDIEAALEIAERGRARAFVELMANRADEAQLTSVSKVPSIQEIRQIAKDQQSTLVEYTLVPDDSFKFQGKQRGTAERLYIWVVQLSGQVDFREVDLRPLQQDKGLSIANLVETSRDRSGIRGNTRGLIRPGDQVRREGEPLDWKPYDVTAIDPRAGTVTLSHPDFVLPNPVVPLSEVYKINSSSFATVLRQTTQWQDLHQLLIAPIAELLPTDPEDRVVFIPQEQLFLVPFPALQADDGSYLIDHHTILSAPAIQILGLTHRSTGSVTQPENQTPPLVVGNPSPMPENLQPLPHAGTEANGIATVLSTRALIGASATETAIKQQLADAPLIHLATHGFFNESNPLQGSLAFVPTDGQDGFLTAEEILSQSLQADLVVLSACDTGRGKITGDGVIGLSRSFLAAGAENVMVSLWQVPDDATAQLMLEFYRQRQHLDNAQALRQAMLATRQQYQDPLAWAAFTLIGALSS